MDTVQILDHIISVQKSVNVNLEFIQSNADDIRNILKHLIEIRGSLNKVETNVNVLLAHHGYGPDGEDFRPKIHTLVPGEDEELEA